MLKKIFQTSAPAFLIGALALLSSCGEEKKPAAQPAQQAPAAAAPREQQPPVTAPTPERPVQPQQRQRVQMANDIVQNDVMKLLIYSAVLSGRTGELGAVDPTIAKRYDRFRHSVYFGTPILVGLTTAGILRAAPATATSATVGATEGSTVAAEAERTRPLVNEMAEIGRRARTASSRMSDASWNSSQKMRIDGAVEASARSSTTALENVSRSVAYIFERPSLRIPALALSAVGLFGSSVGSFADAGDVLKTKWGRKILGYDKELKTRIDEVNDTVTKIYNFDAASQAKFKEALYEEVLEKAKNRHFAPSTYLTESAVKKVHAENVERARTGQDLEIDLVDLMQKNGLISAEQAAVTNALRMTVQEARRFVASATANQVSPTDEEILARNIDLALAISALLEQYVHEGKLVGKDEQTARRLIGNVQTNIRLVQYDLGSK